MHIEYCFDRQSCRLFVRFRFIGLELSINLCMVYLNPSLRFVPLNSSSLVNSNESRPEVGFAVVGDWRTRRELLACACIQQNISGKKICHLNGCCHFIQGVAQSLSLSIQTRINFLLQYSRQPSICHFYSQKINFI